MKNYLSILLTIFIIGYIAPIACGDAGFLSGTGGEGEDAPTEEILPSEESESVENPISTPNAASVTKNSLPSLILISTADIEYVTAVSIPPMGTADYQLTAPNILQAGEEGFIELILTPNTITVNKDQDFKGDKKGIFQLHLGDLLLYPQLKAELVAGSSFSVSPSPSSVQIITMDKLTIWTWYITALKPGEHKISVNISVPVSNAGTTEDFPLETIGFYVSILSPTPTPTFTSTPAPTSTSVPTVTPTPLIGERLSGGAVEITLGLITMVGSITVAIIGFLAYRQNSTKKKTEEDEKNRNIEMEERHNNVKSNLPSNKNKKGSRKQ